MTNYTIKTIGYVIAGAGLDQLRVSLQTGLVLVLFGVALEIVVALLQKYNVPVDKPVA